MLVWEQEVSSSALKPASQKVSWRGRTLYPFQGPQPSRRRAAIIRLVLCSRRVQITGAPMRSVCGCCCGINETFNKTKNAPFLIVMT